MKQLNELPALLVRARAGLLPPRLTHQTQILLILRAEAVVICLFSAQTAMAITAVTSMATQKLVTKLLKDLAINSEVVRIISLERYPRTSTDIISVFQKYLAYDEPPPPPPPGSSSGNEEQDYPSYPNEITLLPILLLLILLGLYTDLRRTSAPEASTDAPKNTTRERRQIRIPEIQHATPHGHLQALTTIYNPLEGLLGNYITTLKDEVVIHPDIQLFDVGEILPCPEGFVKLYFEDTPYCDNIHREHPPSYYEPMTFRKKFDYVFDANGRLLDRWLQHVYIFEGLPWFVSFLIMATRVAWEMFITRGRAVECCVSERYSSLSNY